MAETEEEGIIDAHSRRCWVHRGARPRRTVVDVGTCEGSLFGVWTQFPGSDHSSTTTVEGCDDERSWRRKRRTLYLVNHCLDGIVRRI